jgi:hypothetical protein
MHGRFRSQGDGARFRRFGGFPLFLCRLGWDDRRGVWGRVTSENEGLGYLIEHSYLMFEIMMNLVVEVSTFLHASLIVADDEDDA